MNNSSQSTKKKTSTFERSRTITGALFILPTFVFVCIFVLWPLFQVFRYSMTDWNGISADMNFVGFENFKALTKLDGFWTMCRATVIYAIGVMALTIISAFLMALVLDKKGPLRINRGLMRSLWFFPCLLSGTVIGILWRIMYNYQNGIINTLLKGAGLPKVNWLESPNIAMVAVIIASVWASTGMCIIIFMAGLQSIDGSLYEAASIDGATGNQQLWYITVPMMAPSITINVLTTTIAAFKMYELPLNITNGGPGKATTLITKNIYDLGFMSVKTGMGSALSVVLILIITLISLIQLVYLRKREDIY
ncbi:MAG: sugar ABC transporter permease [Eubacteriales bacterium]|nr:sugar ABC transporter permease [Eubacteriales bacterium]